MMDGCMVLSENLGALQDGALQTLSEMTGNDEELLLKPDFFSQNQVISLSNNILTPTFVTEKVSNPTTQALLHDLRQPPSQLLAAVGHEGLHIFDLTQMIWIVC